GRTGQPALGGLAPGRRYRDAVAGPLEGRRVGDSDPALARLPDGRHCPGEWGARGFAVRRPRPRSGGPRSQKVEINVSSTCLLYETVCFGRGRATVARR